MSSNFIFRKLHREESWSICRHMYCMWCSIFIRAYICYCQDCASVQASRSSLNNLPEMSPRSLYNPPEISPSSLYNPPDRSPVVCIIYQKLCQISNNIHKMRMIQTYTYFHMVAEGLNYLR